MDFPTICAISTAPAVSAIGIVRVSGKDALTVTEKIFDRPLKTAPGYKAVYGNIIDGDKVIDTVLITVFHAPHSYTGEDVAEISCHGSPYILNRVIGLLCKNGAVRAGRGEFSKRAYINGKMDIAQTEAVIDMIEAGTEAELEAARFALDGGVSEKVNGAREKLVGLSAEILAYIDYPDEDIADTSTEHINSVIKECYDDISALCSTYATGRMIKNGIRTVLCGKPNAGKSMLMNRILGEDRSIVTSEAGTTRDVVSETAVFGGLKLNVRDTAGIRRSEDTDDAIERIGIERAEKETENADLIIFVFDLEKGLDADDERILSKIKSLSAKKIAVLNKTDVLSSDKIVDPSGFGISEDIFDAVVSVSAKTGDGLQTLESAVSSVCSDASVGKETLINARQHECLEACVSALRSALDNSFMTPDVILTDVEEAIDSLGSVSGLSVSEQIIENIFSRFCVGK